MVTLTGSGRRETLATTAMGITALQQHPFANKWSWNLTIVGNLRELLEDIREVTVTQSVMVLFRRAKARRRG